MFLVLITLVVLLVAVVSALVIRRSLRELPAQQQPPPIDGENLRPLFMPTDEDLRLAEREAENERRAEGERDLIAARGAEHQEVDKLRNAWRAQPNLSS